MYFRYLTFLLFLGFNNLYSQEIYIKSFSESDLGTLNISIGDILGAQTNFDLEFKYSEKKRFVYDNSYFIDSPKHFYIGKWLPKSIDFYQFIVFPGDSVTLINEESKLRFVGANNAEYNFLHSLEVIGLGLFNLKENRDYQNPKLYSELRNQRLTLLEMADQEFHFRKEFKKYIINMIELQYVWGWSQIFDFKSKLSPDNIINKKEYSDNIILNKKKMMLDSLEIENIYFTSYANSLKVYNKALIWSETYELPNLNIQLKESVNNFNGYHKNLLLTLIIDDLLKANELNEDQINFFFKNCKNKVFSEHIKNKLGTRYKISLNISNNFYLLDKEGNSVILNDFLRKLNYIDIWASWCKPCLSEFSSLEKLEEQYKNSGISFINISVDENIEIWNRTNDRLNLTFKNNYFSKNSFKYLIEKIGIEFNFIPRYLIIDSKGKILDYDAPHPSDPKIKEIFNNLLKEK